MVSFVDSEYAGGAPISTDGSPEASVFADPQTRDGLEILDRSTNNVGTTTGPTNSSAVTFLTATDEWIVRVEQVRLLSMYEDAAGSCCEIAKI